MKTGVIAVEYDLKRFLDAQSAGYETALREIKSGRKRSHWIWYVFPNIAGLGSSPTARRYAIRGIDEARAYLADATLRARLEEISSALLELESCDATEIMGTPDDLKLRSCATLFLEAEPGNVIFRAVLEKFFDGRPDERTLEILRS
jgi:uncharacterized protein (DUF1810 family)